ncbi:N-acetyl-gamma-glutamyl-phosphate reductase [Stetteria hydrogenophila]
MLGASGFTGGELLRLLAFHPEVEVSYATSREYAGRPVHYAHPHLRGVYQGLRFEPLSLDRALEADVVFSALPHGVGVKVTGELYESGVMVVDLSADYRLRDPGLYPRIYGFEHPYPDLLEKAVYGLPELRGEELRGARLIAVPGCNSTAAILAAAPLAASGLLEEPARILVDVKAGSSEAGSKPSRGDHHPLREGAVRPYSARGHRHAVEAEQELSRLAGSSVRVSLVPHAVPAVRGVLASAHAWLREGVDEAAVARAYASLYRGKPFVRLVEARSQGRYPDPKFVAGSNYADVGWAVEARLGRVTGFAAIDNLVKGAAGQAIQAFNVAAGLPEDAGLRIPPLAP